LLVFHDAPPHLAQLIPIHLNSRAGGRVAVVIMTPAVSIILVGSGWESINIPLRFTRIGPMKTLPVMTIYSGPLSMFGAKVQIAAQEKGLDFDLVMVAYDPVLGYMPKHTEVLRINPKGQVPVLTHGELEIFDSTQIFEYLEDLQPNPPLWPRDLTTRARARRLEHQSDEIYFAHIIRLMRLEEHLDDPVALASIQAATAYYTEMEKALGTNVWLAKDYSFADIGFYMAALFGERRGAPITAATPRLLEWRERMTQRPAVRAVAGTMARWLKAAGRPVPQFMAAL
jgi:glutathione S-transferase